jgi:hypothetical protein
MIVDWYLSILREGIDAEASSLPTEGGNASVGCGSTLCPKWARGLDVRGWKACAAAAAGAVELG